MWHAKTRIGTFWIVPDDRKEDYVFGMDEVTLGRYEAVESVITDILNHETGEPKWDESNRVDVPNHVSEWQPGLPEQWQND